jgi:hypothetical protein
MTGRVLRWIGMASGMRMLKNRCLKVTGGEVRGYFPVCVKWYKPVRWVDVF